MQEETIYSDDRVSVTTARVMIRGTTYALRNITSVKMVQTPAKQGCPTLLLVAGIAGMFAGVSFLVLHYSTGDLSGNLGPGLAGVLLAGLVLWVAIRWFRWCKPDHHVAVTTSSGEVHALTSKDRTYIQRVIDSINEAIVRCQ